jgi:hypothetical protein
MSSSSTDRPADDDEPRGFLTVDRGGLVRLGVVLAFAVAALLSPLVGTTSAQFTDSADVSITFSVTPAPGGAGVAGVRTARPGPRAARRRGRRPSTASAGGAPARA